MTQAPIPAVMRRAKEMAEQNYNSDDRALVDFGPLS